MSVPRISAGDTERILFFRIADADNSGPEHDPRRLVRGLLLGLAISVLLWATLAAVGYGAYLLIVA